MLLNRSVLFIGESDSGKTTIVDKYLEYYNKIENATNNIGTCCSACGERYNITGWIKSVGGFYKRPDVVAIDPRYSGVPDDDIINHAKVICVVVDLTRQNSEIAKAVKSIKGKTVVLVGTKYDLLADDWHMTFPYTLDFIVSTNGPTLLRLFERLYELSKRSD
jgi:GTPase SAR1 family protein